MASPLDRSQPSPLYPTFQEDESSTPEGSPRQQCPPSWTTAEAVARSRQRVSSVYTDPDSITFVACTGSSSDNSDLEFDVHTPACKRVRMTSPTQTVQLPSDQQPINTGTTQQQASINRPASVQASTQSDIPAQATASHPAPSGADHRLTDEQLTAFWQTQQQSTQRIETLTERVSQLEQLLANIRTGRVNTLREKAASLTRVLSALFQKFEEQPRPSESRAIHISLLVIQARELLGQIEQQNRSSDTPSATLDLAATTLRPVLDGIEQRERASNSRINPTPNLERRLRTLEQQTRIPSNVRSQVGLLADRVERMEQLTDSRTRSSRNIGEQLRNLVSVTGRLDQRLTTGNRSATRLERTLADLTQRVSDQEHQLTSLQAHTGQFAERTTTDQLAGRVGTLEQQQADLRAHTNQLTEQGTTGQLTSRLRTVARQLTDLQTEVAEIPRSTTQINTAQQQLRQLQGDVYSINFVEQEALFIQLAKKLICEDTDNFSDSIVIFPCEHAANGGYWDASYPRAACCQIRQCRTELPPNAEVIERGRFIRGIVKLVLASQVNFLESKNNQSNFFLDFCVKIYMKTRPIDFNLSASYAQRRAECMRRIKNAVQEASAEFNQKIKTLIDQGQ